MAAEKLNELTFAGWIAEFTAKRTQRRVDQGEPVVVASGAIEERQVDAQGRVRRCDVRFNSPSGRKLASGELKRPEIPEGRDARNEDLRADARRKAIARGLPYYFTCNIKDVVLYEVATNPGEEDAEVGAFALAPITSSSQASAYKDSIEREWCRFLDALEGKLVAVGRTRPTVTTADVVALRDAIFAVAAEAMGRVRRRIKADPTLAAEVREEALRSFNFTAALEARFPDRFDEELIQMLRFGAFVVTQKLVLYRVLEDAGPRRSVPFNLDPLEVPRTSTDPKAIGSALESAFNLAIRRSKDFETAFIPKPLVDLVFSEPEGAAETAECQVGEAWSNLLSAVKSASWLSITQNIVGLLYEIIVEERFRHQLGQFYTPEDVVDLLVAFGVREPGDVVLDPAAGGGSFLRSAYIRKRALGETHESALSTIWGFEITAFAAELSTISLATSDTREAAAYPRVQLKDFFDVRPGKATGLTIPGHAGVLKIPSKLDAVVGNPPYISYRRQTNQAKILNALASSNSEISLPKFSGKTDAYAWFIVHSTQFLRDKGRLSFVVSSAILFSDYGIPLIRFIGHHYRILAVVDSMVERWFADADTNTVLLLLEREVDPAARSANSIRFIRLRRPIAQLIPDPSDPNRREAIEALLEVMLGAEMNESDPRMQVNVTTQGDDGGLALEGADESDDLLDEEES